MKAKEYEEAAERYLKAIELAPNLFNLHLNRSAALLELGRREEALQEALEGLDTAPFKKFPKALYRVGSALAALARLEGLLIPRTAFLAFFLLNEFT